MLQKAPQPAVLPEPELAAIVKTGGRWRRARRYVVLAGLAIVAIVGAWFWLQSDSASSVTYATASVARGNLTVTVTATGTVQPTNQVEVSSELSGTVATVEADFNDAVIKGQVLATLKTDKLDANVTQARAAQTAREADVRQANVTAGETATSLQRAATLLRHGVVTQESYDTAKAAGDRAAAALAVAEANLETAKANLSIAESDRAKATIVSPIDGVVLDRSVEVGQTVASSLQAPVLFTIADDLAHMQLQVYIDEADMGSVRAGDAATFVVAAYPGRTFPATITQIRYAPATIEGVVTYKAILAVDNADGVLRPGMTATADITVAEVTDTLLVPNTALRYSPPVTAEETSSRGGGLLGLLIPRQPATTNVPPVAGENGERTIWVLRDGVPVSVSVKTGLSDGNRTAIVKGDIGEGDQVITAQRTAS